jgi:hypothetical protein
MFTVLAPDSRNEIATSLWSPRILMPYPPFLKEAVAASTLVCQFDAF